MDTLFECSLLFGCVVVKVGLVLIFFLKCKKTPEIGQKIYRGHQLMLQHFVAAELTVTPFSSSFSYRWFVAPMLSLLWFNRVVCLRGLHHHFPTVHWYVYRFSWFLFPMIENSRWLTSTYGRSHFHPAIAFIFFVCQTTSLLSWCRITPTPYVALLLFTTRLAAFAGDVRVSFIQPRFF